MLQHSTVRALLPGAMPISPIFRTCAAHRVPFARAKWQRQSHHSVVAHASSTKTGQGTQTKPQNGTILQLYNTMSRQKEIFTPRPTSPDRVQMYVCGVTVYDYSHIGHARVYVAFDILYRLLQYSGYQVQYVRNFTDIDDKIIARANERGEDPLALSQRFIHEFHADMAALGCLPPTEEPKATDYIPEMITTIERIVENGHAYAVGGDVFFDVESLPGYGQLSGRGKEDNRAGERVSVDSRKRGAADFALWKSTKPGEPSWDSPWGPGRPGWHIECSSMIETIMGNTIDIHGGGRDLVFPHHENELAQSRAAAGPCACCPPHTHDAANGTHPSESSLTNHHNEASTADSPTIAHGSTSTSTTSTSTSSATTSSSSGSGTNVGGEKEQPFVRYWVHNGFVNVDSEKMSKSLGNFFTIRDVLKQYHPLALRWFLVGTHYRAPVNYTQRALEEASDRLYYVYQTLQDVEEVLAAADGEALRAARAASEKLEVSGSGPCSQLMSSSLAALRDDLNTPMVISTLSAPLKTANDLLHTKAGRKQKDRLVQLVGLKKGMMGVMGLLGLVREGVTREEGEGEGVASALRELRELALVRAGLTEEEVQDAIAKRAEARKAKDFAASDAIRVELSTRGVMIMDTPQGTTWRPGLPAQLE